MKKGLYAVISLTIVLFLACGTEDSKNTGDTSAVPEKEWESEEDEKEVHPDSLPEAVTDAVASRYPGATIREADEEKHSDGSVYYEIDLDTEGGEIEALFSPLGEFLGLEEERDAESDVVN